MRCTLLAFVLVSVLTATPSAAAVQASAPAAELARGIRLIEEGNHAEAALVLDALCRRLSGESGKTAELAHAYLYLGIAYVGLGRETDARARFREALNQDRALALKPEEFSPKVTELLEQARRELRAESAPARRITAPPPPKSGSPVKWILLGAGAAAAGVGVALGAGGGSETPAPPPPNPTTENFSGSLTPSSPFAEITTATGRAGAWRAELSWDKGNVPLGFDVEAPGTTAFIVTSTSLSTTSAAADWQGTEGARYVIVVLYRTTPSRREPVNFQLRVSHP